MGEKVKVGPYRMPRERLVRQLSASRGARGDLISRYKRYLRAMPEYPAASDPDESVRRVAPRTDVRGESRLLGASRGSGDLDDDD